jgi:propionyl-CoA synthetase
MIVLKAGVDREPDDIIGELVQIVRDEVGPVANFKQAAVVGRLPKTRSGKVLRRTMRRIANGESYRVPSTIDDPTVLEEITQALRRLGYARTPKGAIGE